MKNILLFLFVPVLIYSQVYIPADPTDLLFTEQKIILGGEKPGSLMIRPVFSPFNTENGRWSLKARSEFFYNSGAPNLENTSNRWVGKGVSFFTSTNLAYKNKYLFASIEPYYFVSQNKDYIEPQRLAMFSQLNDNRPFQETPYTSAGLRETQLYINFKGIGGGYSNANMWWGPGLHSSIMMSNNTTGFGHLMLGTVSEQRYRNWGFNGRYIFSKFGKKSQSKPYYSGFIISTTYYSEPIITLGFSRVFLSGGEKNSYNISASEAALLPFQFVKVKNQNSYSDIINPIEQTYTGYVNVLIPKSGTALYLEWGKNEGPEDFEDLLITANHSNAFTLGVRQYGLFNNSNLFAAIEYTNLAHSSFWEMKETNDWYDNSQFDYYTFDGRHWAAHSGPDSDDFTFLIGYSNNKLSVIPSFNYERHSLTHTYRLLSQEANTIVYDKYSGEKYLSEERDIYGGVSFYSETKVELSLTIKYIYKGLGLSINYEHENIVNYEFRGHLTPEGQKSCNVIYLCLEKDLSGLLNK